MPRRSAYSTIRARTTSRYGDVYRPAAASRRRRSSSVSTMRYGLVYGIAARRYSLTVLHYDGDYDRIAEVTGQPVEWVVPPGARD
ncbi:MAG: hypothetical protein ACRDOK_21255 [Streptosporangiaceae bacterium]